MIRRIGITLAVISNIAMAEIYQWTDDSGQVHYSDAAPKNKPDLKSKNIIIPTAIPATKIAPKAKEKSGSTVIEIESKSSGVNCISQKINSVDRNSVMDAWQDHKWKECRGMQ